jgi:hypothetical protein
VNIDVFSLRKLHKQAAANNGVVIVRTDKKELFFIAPPMPGNTF